MLASCCQCSVASFAFCLSASTCACVLHTRCGMRVPMTASFLQTTFDFAGSVTVVVVSSLQAVVAMAAVASATRHGSINFFIGLGSYRTFALRFDRPPSRPVLPEGEILPIVGD